MYTHKYTQTIYTHSYTQCTHASTDAPGNRNPVNSTMFSRSSPSTSAATNSLRRLGLCDTHIQRTLNTVSLNTTSNTKNRAKQNITEHKESWNTQYRQTQRIVQNILQRMAKQKTSSNTDNLLQRIFIQLIRNPCREICGYRRVFMVHPYQVCPSRSSTAVSTAIHSRPSASQIEITVVHKSIRPTQSKQRCYKDATKILQRCYSHMKRGLPFTS